MTESHIEDKLKERRELLKRAFSRIDLFGIGNELMIPYFGKFLSGWEIDEDEASSLISSRITDEDLGRIFRDHKPRQWAIFIGRYYALKSGHLSLETSWEGISDGIHRIETRYPSESDLLLRILYDNRGLIDTRDISKNADFSGFPKILEQLEQLGVAIVSYKGDKYKEWKILEETLPIIQIELGRKASKIPISKRIGLSPERGSEKEIDYLLEEKQTIENMDHELDTYLEDLLNNRLEQTKEFGVDYNIGVLSNYLQKLFGTVLYFDSLLSITQQYGLANAEIVHEKGKTGRRTGWSMALFGDPGTGKSFSTRDMILGRLGAKISPHGIPGRNRYCGGMTPARFVRIGQAYTGRTFNFIIPEFNDFFKYKGMVEPLKLAMEQGEIKYELHREIIGPYRFTSFFTANYNVSVQDQGYSLTIQDPNFNAIEDRMLCRLHRLTKERYVELAESQMRLALGEVSIEKEARKLRDHLALVYSIQTSHPLVKDRFPSKSVMITPQIYDAIGRARKAILKEIPDRMVKFSTRLEDKVISFACAASLMEYFKSEGSLVSIGKEAIKYAIQLYVEEASVRSGEPFEPREVMKNI